MTAKKVAVVALTRGGAILADRICRDISWDFYVKSEFLNINSKFFSLEGKISDFLAKVFHEYDGFVLIMAAGIAVRSIAPFISDKHSDPAVVVIDEKGKNVISLLSGHLGGGNELTRFLADKLAANPVITTSSDVQGVLALDLFAEKNGCEILNGGDLTKVQADIVNGRNVGFISDFKTNLDGLEFTDEARKYHDSAVFLTASAEKKCAVPYVMLIPKCISIGIGCKAGMPAESIISEIEEFLQQNNISRHSLSRFASIDAKKNEKGIIDAAEHFNIPFITYGKSEILKVENRFIQSEFVRQSVGVGCVCEPCGYLASGGGRQVCAPAKKNGITLAAFLNNDITIEM